MLQRLWRWLLLVFLAWALIRSAKLALTAPWIWDFNQALIVICMLVLCLLLVTAGLIWKRGGPGAVAALWARTWQMFDAARERQRHGWRLAVWTLAALILAAGLNLWP